MADRFPLILNTSANQIQEIASGDQLDLSGNNIANAGVITATTFSGSIAGASNGILGIITAAAADIDDFVEVGSNIQLGNAGVVTATTFKGNGDFVELDVDGHTNLDNVSIAGVVTATTFVGALTGNATGLSGNPSINVTDLDVDGHTNLDNVSVAGVTTFTSLVDANGGATIDNVRIGVAGNNEIDTSSGNLTLDSAAGTVVVDDSLNVNDSLTVTNTLNANGNIVGDSATNITGIAGVTASTFTGTLQTAAQPNITSVGTLGSLNVTGNLSIGGTLTYEDVTNIDSVGIVTARTGLKVLAGGANVVGMLTATAGMFVPDNNQIQVGNAAGSADLRIYHQSSNNHSYISETGSGSLIVLADDFYVQDTSTNTMISAKEGAEVNLHFNSNAKLSTSNTGITVTGNIIQSGSLNVNDSQYLYIGNSGDLRMHHDQANTINYINSQNGNLRIQQGGLTIIQTVGQGPKLYYGGSEKLATTGGGVNITGVCTATSFSGDGSGLTNVGITTEQVTPSSNVATLNLAKDDHKIVASGTYTIDVSGGTEAESHTLRIENSGTANVGFSTYFKFPSGGTPSLPTASGAISLISFTIHKVGSVGIATVLLSGASVNYS